MFVLHRRNYDISPEVVMLSPTPSQLQDLKSLSAQIEQLSTRIREEGPIMDEIQDLQGKSIKLERQAKATRLRKRSLVRRGGKGRALHKKSKPAQAGELDEMYKRMDSLEKKLDEIEDLKDKRQPHVKRRRSLLKELGTGGLMSAGMSQKLTEEKERLKFLEEGIDKLHRAKKLYRRAVSQMQEAKKHISGAKKASVFDIIGVGGIAGELIAEGIKHKKMGRARKSMGPAQKNIRAANKILKSLDLRGTGAGPDLPQLNAFLDIAIDGFFDWGAHEKIKQAEHTAEMSSQRVTRRAKQLDAVIEAFEREHYRVENSIYELYLDAESTAANEIVQQASG
jgi:hypothetical protein